MKTAPSGWANIVSGGNYTYECKLNIAGVDILQSGIYEMTINGSAVSSSASVGGAIAGEINVVVDIVPKDDPDINLNGGTFIWTDGDNASGGTFWSGGVNADGGTFTGIYIPKMASLIPYIRVVDNGNGSKSAWLKMGEYFIDTREKDVKNGKFTAHGYDAMLKAEQTYMPSVTETSMTTKAIVNEIAALIGVGVASETTTILNTTYSVPYYAGQYTAREMLQYIGAAYYGSFIIDDNGNLKLIQLTSTGTNTDIGGRAKSFELSEETLTYNKVVIVTSPTEEITAGLGNNILEFDCPFGTQAMANAILSALSSYEYRGYKAGTALVTPLYEIGDSVTIKDTTVQILKRSLRFNALMASDLEAPYSEEIQHEFIYKRQEERKIERLAANTASEFTIQNTKIEARVEKTTYNEDINNPTTGLKAVVSDLETQVDAKIETWYQNTDPSTAWTTTALKNAHKGDIWHNSSTNKSYRWSGTEWQEIDGVPQSLIDTVDGKRTIFYGTTSGTYANVKTDDYLVDSSSGTTYRWSGSAWVKLLNAPAVNLLPPVYRREYQQGSNTYTSNGITWTVNDDGSVTAKGTATATSYFTLTAQTDTDYPPRAKLDPTKRYRLHGCPSGGSSTTYRMRCQRVLTEGASTTQNDVGSGVTLTANAITAYVYLEVANGYNTGTNGITFYPMLEEGTVSHNYVSPRLTQAAYTSAQFTILDNAIQSKVSQTDYNGNEIASLINQTATTVAISADKLTFDGKTVNINAGGFNVTGSGSSWSFINLTYGNYEAKLNPQGFIMSYSTWNQETMFYNSGITMKYGGNTRGFIGFLSTGGLVSLNLYDTSNTRVIWTTTNTGAINATAFNPTSRIETKSNIKKATGALDKILGTDILSYNLKIEKNEAKRHTGVVIGGKYKVPEDIVAVDEDGTANGVDLYSMVSISWKAIQELKAEVDELKGGK